MPDDEIDLADVALQFARLTAPRADWQKARAHLSMVAREAAGAADLRGDLRAESIFLAELFTQQLGYTGDEDTYDDFANANLIQVIERRCGLPVALGILWLHASHAAGWDAAGVNLPGHFVIALRTTGEAPMVLDPFRSARLDASELPEQVLAPMQRREVLLRLQNNIRLRLFQGGDLAGAATVARDMLRIVPDAVSLWMETGLLFQRIEEADSALECFGRVLALDPESDSGQRARRAMARLRGRKR